MLDVSKSVTLACYTAANLGVFIAIDAVGEAIHQNNAVSAVTGTLGVACFVCCSVLLGRKLINE